MADRAASAASLRVTRSATEYKIKVTDWGLDPEIRYRRSVTSDFDCIPLTVWESAGGLIHGTGYVDPADAFTAIILEAFTGSVVSADFDFTVGQLVLDVVSDAAGSRKGFSLANVKLFPMNFTGRTDDGGMIEMIFEIHPQGQTVSTVPMSMEWLTNIT